MRHNTMPPRLDMTTPTELDAYALALYARRCEAVTVPLLKFTRATISICHQNVAAFNPKRAAPAYKAERGPGTINTRWGARSCCW